MGRRGRLRGGGCGAPLPAPAAAPQPTIGSRRMRWGWGHTGMACDSDLAHYCKQLNPLNEDPVPGNTTWLCAHHSRRTRQRGYVFGVTHIFSVGGSYQGRAVDLARGNPARGFHWCRALRILARTPNQRKHHRDRLLKNACGCYLNINLHERNVATFAGGGRRQGCSVNPVFRWSGVGA